MKSLITDKGRECSKCNKFLPWDDFSKNKTATTGYQSRCKLCCSKGLSEYTRRNKKTGHAPELGFNLKAQLFCMGIKKAGKGGAG